MQTAVIKNNFELIKRKKMDEKNAKLLWKYISTSGKWFSVPFILSLSQKIFYSYYFSFNIFSSFFHPKKKFYKKSLPLAHQTCKKKKLVQIVLNLFLKLTHRCHICIPFFTEKTVLPPWGIPIHPFYTNILHQTLISSEVPTYTLFQPRG